MKNSKIFIIAEAGVNHNGSLDLARKLIDAAKRIGADAIKFQTFKASQLVSLNAEKADYQKVTTSVDESQYAMIRKLELSREDHLNLIEHCREKDIAFLSSPFSEESADLLEALGVDRFKIPSGEITNHPFLKHIAAKGKPIMLSTGMSTLGEVEDALHVIFSAGNRQVSLLHCVTEYPAPFEETNLMAMVTMKNSFQLPIGFSDHSPGIEIAVAAVALGAQIIEKHFTLDRNMQGPDHKASLEPQDFGRMVAGIRNVEVALGTGIKKPAPCEVKNMHVARKSVVAVRDIKRGERIDETKVTIKRPGSGIQPKDLEKVLGLCVAVDVPADGVLTWEHFK